MLSRKVQDLNEEVAIAALRKGLRRGGVGTLRHNAHLKEIKTLGEFLKLAKGYVPADNDARDPVRPRSWSPQKSNITWQGRSGGPSNSNSWQGRRGNSQHKLETFWEADGSH